MENKLKAGDVVQGYRGGSITHRYVIDREKILEKCKGKCDGNVNCEKCKRKDAGKRCVIDNIIDETLEQIDPILKAKDEEIATLKAGCKECLHINSQGYRRGMFCDQCRRNYSDKFKKA
jgi:hypothetical protein